MIITQTPLRVSLLGGGTDFKDFYQEFGGCVLTTAIDKYIYCIIKERFDDKIYVDYSVKEIVDEVSELKHEIVREAMKKTGVTSGVEICFLSDIPSSGSGLGSSSSVAVGVLNALYLYTGRSVSAARLAKEACEIEIDILKKPIGVQDQYIAAYGSLRFLEFTKFGIGTEKVEMSQEMTQDLAEHIMLFFTGTTRESSEVLTEQKKKISSNINNLIEMAGLAKKGLEAVKNRDYKLLGQLVDKSWELKRGFAKKVSSSEIDKIYFKAKRAGAIGCKISGAGGGGFFTAIVEPGKRVAVREALRDYKQIKVGLSVDGSKAIFNIKN